jgi:hypothetical protein
MFTIAEIANASNDYRTGYGGMLGGGSVIWLNTAITRSTMTHYFYVVRIA